MIGLKDLIDGHGREELLAIRTERRGGRRGGLGAGRRHGVGRGRADRRGRGLWRTASLFDGRGDHHSGWLGVLSRSHRLLLLVFLGPLLSLYVADFFTGSQGKYSGRCPCEALRLGAPSPRPIAVRLRPGEDIGGQVGQAEPGLPRGGFLGLAPGLVELHQPVDGFGQAELLSLTAGSQPLAFSSLRSRPRVAVRLRHTSSGPAGWH